MFEKVEKAKQVLRVDFEILKSIDENGPLDKKYLDRTFSNSEIKRVSGQQPFTKRLEKLIALGFLKNQNEKIVKTKKIRLPQTEFEWRAFYDNYYHEFSHGKRKELGDFNENYKKYVRELILKKNKEDDEILKIIITNDITLGDGKIAFDILKSGNIDLSYKDWFYLKHATQHKKNDIVKYLLKNPDININAGRGFALRDAITNANKELFDLLVNKTDLSVDDWSPLRSASRGFILAKYSGDKEKEHIYYYMLFNLMKKSNALEAIDWLENKKPKAHDSKTKSINTQVLEAIKSVDTKIKMKSVFAKEIKDKKNIVKSRKI